MRLYSIINEFFIDYPSLEFVIAHDRVATVETYMKKYLYTTIVVVSLIATATVLYLVFKVDRAPQQLARAAQAYKAQGVNAFLPALFQSEKTSVKLPKSDVLSNVEKVYGSFVGLEMVGTLHISRSTKIVFFILKYQDGPLYGVITLYAANGGEKITGFKVHTSISHVYPTRILGRFSRAKL